MSTIQHIIKRNGSKVTFDRSRIFNALNKAFQSENVSNEAEVDRLTDLVIGKINDNLIDENTIHVEFVQDTSEEVLMLQGHAKVARSFIIYRERHKLARQEKVQEQIKERQLQVLVNETDSIIFDPKQVEEGLRALAPDLMRISITEMLDAVTSQVYDKIPQKEIDLLILSAARERIEVHHEYSYLASRICISDLYKKILKSQMHSEKLDIAYRERFKAYIEQGVAEDMLNPALLEFDHAKLAAALQPERDKLFKYLGIQVLIDRYFMRDRSQSKAVYELPQWFWMRVAMGLAIQESNREDAAISFYNVLSNMDLVSSTPTLFNSGTTHSQMSSCYLNIAEDSLEGIFKQFSDNAKLSKWAGGIGTDWTNVRATGSKIKGTNGESQGVIPFLKIFNDVALAVNQGGKRKGAMCAYMEIWHLDIEQFFELKKNTGDERRRTHDINTACWINDLFMKRVEEDGQWTLFCPGDVPDLHDAYGKDFEEKYMQYEAMNLPRAKSVSALTLWRRLLTMLFETGHPWVTFKDPANVRSPQDHVGVVHSSNLCTEITLNTSKDETAVCNLASINLANMIKDGHLNEEKIEQTIGVGMRMLDNVIDNNFYPIPEAENANIKHRAVGLGLMGYQDALYMLNINFDSEENMEFADLSMEMISYYAILASSRLSKERGAYPSYKGSKWDRGIFPYDSVQLLSEERGQKIDVNPAIRMDWESLKEHVKKFGMRNSNTMAIAPTATIANISGVYPCTEPAYKNIYMKENLSGNFVIINTFLEKDLDALALWNPDIVRKIKFNNGSIQKIQDIPEHIRNKYKETFEIDAKWIITAASLRAKWIDQSASTNVFLHTSSGRVLNDTYMMAWKKGLKTTYYLRTLGASQIQKATTLEEDQKDEPGATDATTSSAIGQQFDQRTGDAEIQAKAIEIASPVTAKKAEPVLAKACLISDPDCEACQ